MSNVIDRGKVRCLNVFAPLRSLYRSLLRFYSWSSNCAHPMAAVDGLCAFGRANGRSCWCSGHLLHGKGIDEETI